MGNQVTINQKGEVIEVSKTPYTYNQTIIRTGNGVTIHNGPLMLKSEQNKEWEAKRPDAEQLARNMRNWMNWGYQQKPHRYNRKHTNDLRSHHGESRNSRADKMSGADEMFRKILRGSSKKKYKKFYSAKRRMFLKNELFFDKI